MSDQREHGVGGLEWRDLPARTPDEPLVPSTGETGEPADETVVSPAVPGDGGTGARAGDQSGPEYSVDPDADTRRFEALSAPDLTEGPVDLAALRADDDLLSALTSFDTMDMPDQDPELKSLLQSWRLDVDAEPIGELVDVDTAMAAIAVGARLHKRRPRYLLPLAAGAAALVVLFAGMGVAARTAVPGDALWGISQVLYTDHARSVEAAAQVRDDLHNASVAMQRGHFVEARDALVQAQASLPSVDSADGKANLQAQQQNLLDQLDDTTALTPQPTTTSPGYGAPVGSSSASQSQSAPDTATKQQPPPAQQSTTTTQPPPPPPTTTEPTTTDQPPPTTTDPGSPQTDTLGNNPAQQPPDGPTAPDDPDSSDTSLNTATS